jgi:hypothetical protein
MFHQKEQQPLRAAVCLAKVDSSGKRKVFLSLEADFATDLFVPG